MIFRFLLLAGLLTLSIITGAAGRATSINNDDGKRVVVHVVNEFDEGRQMIAGFPDPAQHHRGLQSSGTSSVNPCLDPTSTDFKCELDEDGFLHLTSCGLTDDDLADIATCLDDVGRENIIHLRLYDNALTTLPAGLFEGLTALELLRLDHNALTTLPAGLFEGLTALETLYLFGNEPTTLPAGLFEGLKALERLSLSSNELTTLPAGLFEGLTALETLWLHNNELTILPEGLFEGLTALRVLYLYDNALTTLPAGLFEGLTALELLSLYGNSLECLPTTSLVAVDDASVGDLDVDGLHVDPYGDECGCSIMGFTDNVCGDGRMCTSGEFGYTCEGTLAPVPAPTEAPVLATEAPVPAPTAAPVPAPTAAPVPAPELAPEPTTAPNPSSEGDSDTTPMIAGVVSTVAGAVVIGLGLWLRRRREKNRESSQSLPATSRNVGHDPGFEPQAGTGSGTTVIVDDGGHPSPHGEGPSHPPDANTKTAAAVASDNEDIVSTSDTTVAAPMQAPAAAPEPAVQAVAPAPTSSPEAAGPLQAIPRSPGQENIPGKESCPALGGGDAKDSTAEEPLTATVSTTNMSTAEQAELGQFYNRVAGAASVAGEESTLGGAGEEDRASSISGRRGSRAGIGLGEVVLEAAQNLAYNCQIPGVSEAASVVSTLVKLVADNRDIKSGGDSNLRKCRSIVGMLERASEVAGRVGETTTAEQRDLIEEVHDAVEDMVELIKMYQSKNKLSKVLMSTSFKRRQEDLEAAIDRAIGRLQFGLQVQQFGLQAQVNDDVSAVKEGINAYQGSIADAKSETRAEVRRARRRRKLGQIEIPEDQVVIFEDELLGKGGFGKVFLAEYNTRNAAAKVMEITHDLGKHGEDDVLEARSGGNKPNPEGVKSQRKAFLRELDVMFRLRSPHTVGVYGAVTSRPDHLVLVMELLPGGDLRTLLKNAEQPLPEEQSRRIIGDVCAGMHFLHSKETVHGDLKSANVLLDGAGRAKIGDFGTSRWSHHTGSTGLATYTKAGQNTQMSLAWSAPEVLDAAGSTYASDVYSFGVVAWEVLSRELPWASVAHPREVYIRVVLKSLRLDIPSGAPADLANMMRACWASEAKARPTFSSIMERIESNGWSE